MGFQIRRLLAQLSGLSKPWTTFLALLMAALLGLVDFATGYDFYLTAFYLVPICWACWAAGRKAGLFLATACAAIFWVADLMAGHPYKHPLIPFWNALMLLALYVGAVHILSACLSAYHSIREGESRFQALFTQSLLGVAQVRTATGEFVRVNDRFCAVLGCTAEECLRTTSQAITQPEDLPNALENVRRLSTGEIKQLTTEQRYLRKDRSVIWASLVKLPLWSPGEPPDFHLELVEDITARRQAEERLRQSQKLEGIGQLAGGMAHEFNNILAAIVMNLELVETLSSGAETQDLLHEVQSLCARAAGLIKQLLAFSRRSVMQLRPIDLAAAVSGQLRLLDRLLGERITLEFSSTPNPPWVNADKVMIEQVLLNLCLNARDAMKTSGRLQLHLAAAEIGAEKARSPGGAQPGEYVCLSIADTGCGMDEPTLKRLFEPFFTTKDVGQGTGLGLATVRGIVEQHHGWVEVESRPRKGSTFRIYLPAVTQPLTTPPVFQAVAAARGRGTILMVEDEPGIRKPTRMFLVRAGYVVLEAADSKEALALWKEHRAEINLVHTDMVMPGELTGLQLAERLLADKPGVKVIITSGYSMDVLDLSKVSGSSIIYLPKPCPPATLTSVVQECLQPVRG